MTYETWGEVLFHGSNLADPRFATVCGGISEEFHNVWGGEPKPYLRYQTDSSKGQNIEIQIISSEKDARKFIDSMPPVICNPAHFKHLTYLKYAHDLFRWRKTYERRELEEIIKRKTNRSIGTLLDLVPLKRGPSGRILNLKIIGTQGEIQLNSELEIRRVLDRTHLPSSCFYTIMEKEDGIPVILHFVGAGWGHGVGMCQVGAIHRAYLGQTYKEILNFYYPGTELRKIY